MKLKYLIYTDLHRYGGNTTFKNFLKLFFTLPGFKYSVLLRISNHFYNKRSIFLYPFLWLQNVYGTYFGICISHKAKIGTGLYIGHFGSIVVHRDAVIGNNCNLSHGATIGQTNRGVRKGVPKIGNNVFIGAGAVVLGKIKIGNNVAVGANCVVTKDVPNNAVVVGIPSKIISYKGSEHYVNNTDYSNFE